MFRISKEISKLVISLIIGFPSFLKSGTNTTVQETVEIKKIIIDDLNLEQRLLTPSISNSDQKIKLIPPDEVKKKVTDVSLM